MPHPSVAEIPRESETGSALLVRGMVLFSPCQSKQHQPVMGVSELIYAEKGSSPKKAKLGGKWKSRPKKDLILCRFLQTAEHFNGFNYKYCKENK